jgi:hypothetical protein
MSKQTAEILNRFINESFWGRIGDPSYIEMTGRAAAWPSITRFYRRTDC